jgi:hypothetical protein
MMSTTSSPGGLYTRGAAQPGLCNSNGCSWKIVNGVNTWVCCCNQYLCNTGVPTTTPRPVGNTCYFCSNCPRPFNRYSTSVIDVYSTTGWCTVSLFFPTISMTRSTRNNDFFAEDEHHEFTRWDLHSRRCSTESLLFEWMLMEDSE